MNEENRTLFDMPADGYRKEPGLSNSELKWFRKSPAHYRALVDGKIQTTQSKSQQIGTLVHSLILEGREDFVVAPEFYSSKDGEKPWNRNATFCKEWEATQTKPVISKEDAISLFAASNAIKSHGLACKLFTDGQPEVSLFARCPRTGILLKARFDYLKQREIVDLKTAANADTRNFVRAIASYQYAAQAAHYSYIAKLLGMDISDFYFVALELNPLPMPNVILLSQQDLEIATESLYRTLEEFAECESENRWPGYCDDKPIVVQLPAYAHDLDNDVLDLNA